MVRLVDYSDSSEEEGKQKRDDTWWRHHAGRKNHSDNVNDGHDFARSFGGEGNGAFSTDRERPGSAKRVKSPPGSTTSSLPSYVSSAASSPWASPDSTSSQRGSESSSTKWWDSSPDATEHKPQESTPSAAVSGRGTRFTPFQFKTKGPASPLRRSFTSVFASSSSTTFSSDAAANGAASGTAFGRPDAGAKNPPVAPSASFTFSQASTQPAWPKDFVFGVDTEAKAPNNGGFATASSTAATGNSSEPFRTTLAQDAYRKMKTRLSFGGTSGSDSDKEAPGGQNHAATGVTRSVSFTQPRHTAGIPSSEHGPSLFMPPPTTPGFNAKQRSFRDLRRSHTHASKQPASTPPRFGPTPAAADLLFSFGNPTPSSSTPASRLGSLSDSEVAFEDARMDSPSSASGSKTSKFSFGTQQRDPKVEKFGFTSSDQSASTPNPHFRAPEDPAARDTVMNDANNVAFTNVFARDGAPAPTFPNVKSTSSKTTFGFLDSSNLIFTIGKSDADQTESRSFLRRQSTVKSSPRTTLFGEKQESTGNDTPGHPTRTHSANMQQSPATLRRRRLINAHRRATSSVAKEQCPADLSAPAPSRSAQKSHFQSSGHHEAVAQNETTQQPTKVSGSSPDTSKRFQFNFPSATTQNPPYVEKSHPTYVFGAAPMTPPATKARAPGEFMDHPATPINPAVGSGAQFPFGMATPSTPFVFGTAHERDQEADEDSVVSDFTFDESKAAAFDKSARKGDSQRKLRSSFRRKATLGTVPRAHFEAFSSDSPFGLNTPSTRKTNIFQQKRAGSDYSTPVDPFVTRVFQQSTKHSESVSSFDARIESASTKQDSDFSFVAGSRADVNGPTQGTSGKMYTFGSSSTAQQEESNKAFLFTPTDWKSGSKKNVPSSVRNSRFAKKQNGQLAKHTSSQSGESNGQRNLDNSNSSQSSANGVPNPLPPRRILRAVRPSQIQQRKTSPTNSSTGEEDTDEYDAKMHGEESDESDENDWGELKRLGGIAYSRRDFKEAAELYRQSIAAIEMLVLKYPDLKTIVLTKDKAKLHANRAAALMMLMLMSEAQWECQRSIEVDPTYAAAYIRLARIQILLGDIVQAKQNIGLAKQQLSQHFFMNVNPADTASIEKMEVSIAALSKLQEDIKWSMDVADWPKVLKLVDEALTLSPNSRSLYTQKTQALFQQKNYIAVVRYCNEVVQKHNARERKVLSPRRGIAGKSKAEQSVTIVGVDMGLHWASALHYQNKSEEALVLVNALEQVAPCSANVIQLKRKLTNMRDLKHHANDAFKRNDFDRAVTLYSQALRVDPHHEEYCAVVYCNRAAALMGLGKFESALLDCEDALKRKPQYSRALLRRARCNVALKKYHEALKDFDRYIKEQRKDSSAAGSLGEAETERAHVKSILDREKEEKKKRDAEARRRAQQQKNSQRYAWENSGYYDYEDYRYSSSYFSRANSAGRNGGTSGGWYSSPPSSAAAAKPKQRTHYQVLGIHQRATADEVKKAYRKLALQYHPDKAKSDNDAEMFKDMSAAHTVLSDPAARKKYDLELLYKLPNFVAARRSLEFVAVRFGTATRNAGESMMPGLVR
ncbi:Dnaj subfamily c member 7, partial [Globisporangium splendens]